MPIFRAAISILVMLFAAGVAVTNWSCVIKNLRGGRKGNDDGKANGKDGANEGSEQGEGQPSMVPILSLILTGLVAYPICPFPHKEWMAIIPALDIGNWAVVLAVPVALFQGLFRKEPPSEDEH